VYVFESEVSLVAVKWTIGELILLILIRFSVVLDGEYVTWNSITAPQNPDVVSVAVKLMSYGRPVATIRLLSLIPAREITILEAAKQLIGL
jgi:hypothetical protein